MSDKTGLPGSETAETDATVSNSPDNDIAPGAGAAAGMDRAERQREKIRRELVKQYFSSDQPTPDNMLSRMKKLFGYD